MKTKTAANEAPAAATKKRRRAAIRRERRRAAFSVSARFGPIELAELPRHADGVDVGAANAEALHGQCIEHFIRDDDAAKPFRQPVEPFHASDRVGHTLLEERSLALAQVGAHFEDQVALRQGALRRQLAQEIRRHDS